MWTKNFLFCISLKLGVRIILFCLCIPGFNCLLWHVGIATCSHDPQATWIAWDTFWWVLVLAASLFGFYSLYQGKKDFLKYYTILLLLVSTLEFLHFIIRQLGNISSWHSYDYQHSDRLKEGFGEKELVEWLKQGYWNLNDSRVSLLEWHLEFCPIMNILKTLVLFYFSFCVYSHFIELENKESEDFSYHKQAN